MCPLMALTGFEASMNAVVATSFGFEAFGSWPLAFSLRPLSRRGISDLFR
jgi:hypothetical protein